jgi:hypothetical protein
MAGRPRYTARTSKMTIGIRSAPCRKATACPHPQTSRGTHCESGDSGGAASAGQAPAVDHRRRASSACSRRWQWATGERPAALVVAVPVTPPTFVGSQPRRLPRQRDQGLTDSQHARAMQVATAQTVLVISRIVASSAAAAPRSFQARWQVSRPHRRPGWQARRLRGRTRSASSPAAVPDRAARRSPAGAYPGLGYDSKALVQSVSERNDPGARRTALDWKATELEFRLR